MIRLLSLPVLTCLFASAGLAADSFYGRYFAPPCYARAYDATHLADNPAQRVTSFYVTDNLSDN
ncbi:MAG: hypothetical protein GY788_17720, partial [bacterium]|nr:hypothetical protein [bacterium]